MTDQPQQVHRCAAPGCKASDGEPRQITAGIICPACDERAEVMLASLPPRYVALGSHLRPGSSNGERVSGIGFKSNSPVRDSVLSAMDEMAWWLRITEAEVRCNLDMPPAAYDHARREYVVVRATQTLLRQWPRTMLLPFAPSLINGVLHWRIRADRLLGWDRLRHRLPAPCPYCDTLTLVRDNGDNNVHCTVCQRQWIEAEYRHFVRMLVDELKGA